MMKRASLIVVLLLLIAVPAAAQQVRVKGNGTPLRSEPTVSSNALVRYQAGTRLYVLQYVDGFYQVRDPQTGAQGYVLATLVDVVPGTTTPPEVSRPPAGAPPHGVQPRSPAPGQLPTTRQPVAPPVAVRKPAAKTGGWTDRGVVALSVGYQNGLPGFSHAFPYTEHVEETTITTAYPAKKGIAGDIGGAIRVWRKLALNVSVTMASRSGTASVTGAIPHPFHFDRGRPISGSAPVKRTEIAVHPFVSWSALAGRRFLIVVGGGPSVFNLSQSLVDRVSYTDSYPFDSATFASADVARPSAWGVGYGGSVDVGYYFTKTVGVGMIARYSRGTVALSSHGSTVKVDTGGFEGGLGLRFRIPRRTPKRPPTTRPLPQPPPVKR